TGPFSSYTEPYRKRMFLGAAAIAVSQVAAACIPLILSSAVDSLAAEGASPEELLRGVRRYLLQMFLLALVVAAGGYSMRRLLGTMSTRIEYDIRRTYFAHLVRMPLSFFQRHRTGDLMARATNDLNAVSVFFTYGLRSLIELVLILAFSLAMMSVIHWKLTLIVLVPLPVLCLVTVRMSSLVHNRFRSIQDCFGDISNFVQESLAGIRVVKSFVLGGPRTEAFDRLNSEYLAHNHRYIRARALFRPLSLTIASFGLGINLLFGGREVIAGTLSIGDFVAFNAYLTLLIRPISYSGWVIDRLQRALVAIRRIDEILSHEPESAGDSRASGRSRAAPATATMAGAVHWQGVDFSYDGQPVLSGIELYLPAGKTLGVIGRVGAGKSTLARLPPRLIEPQRGTVTIDGKSVSEWPLEELRRSIGYVSQQPFLFSTSVAGNIAYGVESAADARIREAATRSLLDRDIEELEEGLATVIGERGVTLSGGQKQRCTLARALLREPRILILDDALSAVDTQTEEAILGYLREAMRGRTTIVIAHRISTLRHADLIVTLDDGRIVESGDHESLERAGGLYSELHERQQLSAELESL
ncbi:MAG: ABC transporter ATP-binding protein, partial [Gemmatimonadetes bacterium]|nr:ABC transporter ATP-binding protein [Gemmatimonadota bacterium]